MLKNYYSFSGRLGAKRYWWLFLGNVVIVLLAGVAMDVAEKRLWPLVSFFSTALLLLVLCMGSLAMTVRRIHDSGRSGWWAIAPIAVFPEAKRTVEWWKIVLRSATRRCFHEALAQ